MSPDASHKRKNDTFNECQMISFKGEEEEELDGRETPNTELFEDDYDELSFQETPLPSSTYNHSEFSTGQSSSINTYRVTQDLEDRFTPIISSPKFNGAKKSKKKKKRKNIKTNPNLTVLIPSSTKTSHSNTSSPLHKLSSSSLNSPTRHRYHHQS